MPRKVPLPSLLGNLVRFWCGMRCWVTPGFAPNILRPEKGICAVRILVRDLGGWHAQVLRICFAPYYEPDLGTDLGHDLAWLGRWGGTVALFCFDRNYLAIGEFCCWLAAMIHDSGTIP